MPPAGFEPAIPAGERLQTHALDLSATGIGQNCPIQMKIDVARQVFMECFIIMFHEKRICVAVLGLLGAYRRRTKDEHAWFAEIRKFLWFGS